MHVASITVLPTLPSVAPTPLRAAAPLMGFGPSPKELSDDPPIADVLRVCKADQAARFARAQMGGSQMMRSLPGAGPFGYFDPFE